MIYVMQILSEQCQMVGQGACLHPNVLSRTTGNHPWSIRRHTFWCKFYRYQHFFQNKQKIWIGGSAQLRLPELFFRGEYLFLRALHSLVKFNN